MPWHVEQGGGTCGSSQWAVIKDSDGSTAGCHDTKESAQAQVAALYANEDTMTASTIPAELRQLRRDHAREVPSGSARVLGFPSRFEVRLVDWKGEQRYHVRGTASAYEQPYEMWDLFGPYNEIVSAGAGKVSLAAEPDVAFLVNHRGVTMARTTNESLFLTESTGLDYDAYVNPKRQDVRDLVTAVEDKLITESSFAFTITDGEWNDDFTEYRINVYDINRGDVSAVNYGANPYTSVAARSREILADLDHLPAGAVRAALARLQARTDLPTLPAPERVGMSVAFAEAMLALEDE
jgi:HK97 family phage prohead protease